MKKLLLILLLVSTLSTTLTATTYYVKATGGTGSGLDDTNAWSYAKFNSTALSAGDVVNFNRGDVFYGAFTARSGASGNPITYQAYGTGNNPVISGLVSLTSWTNSSTNIYYATLASPGGPGVQISVIDGVMKPRGRYPNTGFLTYTSHTGFNQDITGASIGTLPTSFVGGEVVIKKYRYILDRHTITGQAGNTITYSTSSSYGNNAGNPPTDGNGYFIQNHPGTLDQDGEWCYEPALNRYTIYSTTNPSGRSIKVGNIANLVSLNSASYITFNNLDFEGAAYGIYDGYSNTITFNNTRFYNCGMGIYGIGMDGLTVTNVNMTNMGSNGIFIEADGNHLTVTGSTFDKIGIFPGMNESGDGKGSAIAANANNYNASNNIVKNVGFNGIGFEGDSVLIYRNRVDSTNLVKDDGAGIYCHTLPPYTDVGGFHPQIRSNRVISQNIVTNAVGQPDGAQYNGDTNPEAAGIYSDGYANHTLINDNTIQKASWMGIFINANSTNSVTNNITYDGPIGLAVNQVDPTPLANGNVSGMVVSGNQFIAKTSGQIPLFINIIGSVYQPQNMGTWFNNVYARPVNDNLNIKLARSYSGGGTVDYTVANWKSTYPIDSGSTSSAITTASPSNIRLDYNATTTDNVVVPLTGIYKNVAGQVFTNQVILNAFQSEVSVFYQSSSGNTVKTTPEGKILITLPKRFLKISISGVTLP